MSKVKGYGSHIHVAYTPKKRPGRHAKHWSKRIPKRKKSVGQGS